MSWNARRYQKRIVRIPKRRLRQKNRERRVSVYLPGKRNNLIRIPQPEELREVFGSPSPSHAFRVCARVKRIKRRLLEAEGRRASRKRLKQRNYHHLTPRCRKGEPHHGGSFRNNLLLIKLRRHEIWHRIFGVMTIEEVTSFLFVLRRILNSTRPECEGWKRSVPAPYDRPWRSQSRIYALPDVA